MDSGTKRCPERIVFFSDASCLREIRRQTEGVVVSPDTLSFRTWNFIQTDARYSARGVVVVRLLAAGKDGITEIGGQGSEISSQLFNPGKDPVRCDCRHLERDHFHDPGKVRRGCRSKTWNRNARCQRDSQLWNLPLEHTLSAAALAVLSVSA